MNIRPASEADLPALAQMCRQTVLVNAPQYYDTEVVNRQGVPFERYLVERHLRG